MPGSLPRNCTNVKDSGANLVRLGETRDHGPALGTLPDSAPIDAVLDAGSAAAQLH